MGLEFTLEHASIVGWLSKHDFPLPFYDDQNSDLISNVFDYYTSRRYSADPNAVHFEKWGAPRSRPKTIESLLKWLPSSLIGGSNGIRESLNDRVAVCQRRYFQEFESHLQDTNEEALNVFSSAQVAKILAPLREWFFVPFYFLVLGETDEFASLVAETPDYTLWLKCTNPDFETNDLLDPFPQISSLTSLSTWRNPGVLCWDSTGESFYVPSKKANLSSLVRLSKEFGPQQFWKNVKTLKANPVPPFHILHLSDLHFGLSGLGTNRSYVEQHLKGEIESLRSAGGSVQPVITGDLTDSATLDSLSEFESFRRRLSDIANAEVVVIPGNHDVRKKGFFWRRHDVISRLDWKPIVESEVSKTIFLCFNTSINAIFAKGKIDLEDLRDMKNRLDSIQNRRMGEDSIRIALVHHHVFSSHDDEVNTVFGVRDEPFVEMTNSQKFLLWCAEVDIPIVLHGHKHASRYYGQEVPVEDGTRLVRAIGCGTTFGVGGKPLSYNLIRWIPENQTWSASYYSDIDGAGFKEKRLTLGNNF